MKAFAKRTVLLLFLIIFAICWVTLMSLELSGTGSAEGADGSRATVTYVDESEFPQVTVYLSVVDGAAQPIISLGHEAFALTEDSIPVNIENFIGAGNQPIVAILVIDHSGSMDHDDKMAGARRAAHTFLDQLKIGQDRVGVIAFDDDLTTLSPLKLISETDQQRLKSKISGLEPRGGTAFYDAVHKAVEDLQAQRGRRVVIALTDGMDTGSYWWLNNVIDWAEQHKTPVYTIGLGRDVEESELEKMAGRTGGKYYFSPDADQLAALYKDLANALQNEYSLTYTSPTPRRDGARREIDAVVTHPGAALSAAGEYNPGGVLSVTLNLPLFVGLAMMLGSLLFVPGGLKLLTRYRPERVTPTPSPLHQPPPQPPVYTPPPQRPDSLHPPPTPQPGQASSTCTHCGSPIRPQARFCPKCGRPCVLQ